MRIVVGEIDDWKHEVVSSERVSKCYWNKRPEIFPSISHILTDKKLKRVGPEKSLQNELKKRSQNQIFIVYVYVRLWNCLFFYQLVFLGI